MGKISELEMAISELRTAAATINDVADTLAGMFSSKEAADPTVAEAPVVEKQPQTLDQVSNTLMQIFRISRVHSQKLREVVRSYGVQKLSDVAPEHYEEILAKTNVVYKVRDIRFATKLRTIKHDDQTSPGTITMPTKPRKMIDVQGRGMSEKETKLTMGSFIPLPTIPVLSAIVNSVIGIAETVIGSDEKFRRLIPLTACVIGAICGMLAFYFVPGVMDTQNLLDALILGASSGLSASCTRQVIMQPIKATVTEE